MTRLNKTSGVSFANALSEPLRNLPAVRVLERASHQGRLGHAMLLHGPRMVDLDAVAMALAGTLLKTDREPTRHPDCFTLRPAKRGRQIQVGDRHHPEENSMRWLIQNIHQTSLQDAGKVAVVYEADRMNDSTANAFLKTLEEPPPGSTILLLTTRPYDLLPTIHSRCLRFRIHSGTMTDHSTAWSAWLSDYQIWLGDVWRGAQNAKERAQLLFGAYGLMVRFLDVMAAESSVLAKTTLAEQAEGLEAEEKEALQVGITKGLRNGFLGDVELATRDFAARECPDSEGFQALAEVLSCLERATGLLEVNLRDDAALEYFFLNSLRIWAAHRRV